MLAGLDTILERTSRRNIDHNQMSLMDSLITEVTSELKLPKLPEFSASELLVFEKEYLGVYLTGHPLDAWRDKFGNNGIIPLADLEEEPDGKEVFYWVALLPSGG